MKMLALQNCSCWLLDVGHWTTMPQCIISNGFCFFILHAQIKMESRNVGLAERGVLTYSIAAKRRKEILPFHVFSRGDSIQPPAKTHIM